MNAAFRWFMIATAIASLSWTLSSARPLRAADRQPAIVPADQVRDPFAALRTEELAADDEHWELSGLALETLGSLEGAVYDERYGTLVLIGPPAEATGGPYHLDDFVVALRSVFFERESIGMSIDPDPSNPEAPQHRVTYSGGCQDTALGWVMFECDRLLKCYSAGRDNFTGEPLAPKVAGFYSVFDLRQAMGSQASGKWNRFFLTLDPKEGEVWQQQPTKSNGYQPAVFETANGRAIAFASYRVYLATQVMERGSGGKLVPSTDPPEKAAERFANHFTANYAEFAKVEPVFARLEAAGRLLMLADWIQKERIPIDLDYLRSYQQQVVVITPTVTPVVERAEESRVAEGNGIRVETRKSTGGVEFESKVFFASDKDGQAAGLASAAAAELGRRPNEVAWTATVSGTEQRFVSIPTQSARFKRKTARPLAAARLAEGPAGASEGNVESHAVNLPPAMPSAQSDRASRVPPIEASLSSLGELDLTRKLARGTPGKQTFASLTDVRHLPESDRSSHVAVEQASLSLLSASVERIRGPPADASIDGKQPPRLPQPDSGSVVGASDRGSVVGREPITLSQLPRPPNSKSSPSGSDLAANEPGSAPSSTAPSSEATTGSDRGSVVGREPISLNQMPRPPNLEYAAAAQELLSKLDVDLAAEGGPASDRSSLVAREVAALTSLRPLSFDGQSRAEVRNVAYYRNASPAGADLGLPLYLGSSGTRLSLPRLVQTSFSRGIQRSKSIQGIAGSDLRVPDQLVIASESGDIRVLFGEPEIDQDRTEFYFPPLDPAPPQLKGYYPKSNSLSFHDGSEIEFDRSGTPVRATDADGTQLEFLYTAVENAATWKQPIACRVTAGGKTTSYSLVATNVVRPTTASKPLPPAPPKPAPIPPIAEPKIAAETPSADRPLPSATGGTEAALASVPAAGELLRLELNSVPAAGESYALPTPIRITASDGAIRWNARLHESSSNTASAEMIPFSGPGGENLAAVVRPASGFLEDGQSTEIQILVGRSANASSAANLESSAKFFVAIHSEPFNDSDTQATLTIPVRIDPGSSGGGIGLIVLLLAAGVCFGVFMLVMVQNSR